MTTTLSYTCCDKSYEDFVPLFAAATLFHNDDFVVEVGLEDIDSFMASHRDAVAVVREAFGEKQLRLSNVSWTTAEGQRLLPNVVRFVTVPQTTGMDYIYLTDVDIIVLDTNVTEVHLEHMARQDSVYSNMVRKGTKRMSGLHFTVPKAQYPLPDLSDVDLVRTNDEEVLYTIVERRGTVIYDDDFRPVHGIHVSPNRDARGGSPQTPGWGAQTYAKQFLAFDDQPLMRELEPLLSPRVQSCLQTIREVIGAPSRRATLDASTRVEGRVDVPVTTAVSGWARVGDATATVDVSVDGQEVAAVRADLPRPDLADEMGDGHHGFRADLPATLRDGGEHEVEVRVRGVVLPAGATGEVPASFAAASPADTLFHLRAPDPDADEPGALGAVVGEQGWLFPFRRDGSPGSAWDLARFEHLTAAFGEMGRPYLPAVSPAKELVYHELAPPGLAALTNPRPLELLRPSLLRSSAVGLLDLLPVLRDVTAGQQVFHRTSSGLNADGGLWVARALLREAAKVLPAGEAVAVSAPMGPRAPFRGDLAGRRRYIYKDDSFLALPWDEVPAATFTEFARGPDPARLRARRVPAEPHLRGAGPAEPLVFENTHGGSLRVVLVIPETALAVVPWLAESVRRLVVFVADEPPLEPVELELPDVVFHVIDEAAAYGPPQAQPADGAPRHAPPRSTSSSSAAVVAGALAPCTVCGGTDFGAGPGGRLSETERLPACKRCGSLERQRIARRVVDLVPERLVAGKRVLQVGPESSFDPASLGEVTVVSADAALDSVDAAAHDWVDSHHTLNVAVDDLEVIRDMLRIAGPDGAVLLTVGGTPHRFATEEFRVPTGPHGLRRYYGNDFADRVMRAEPAAGVLEVVATDLCTAALDVVFICSTSAELLAEIGTALTPYNIFARVVRPPRQPQRQGPSRLEAFMREAERVAAELTLTLAPAAASTVELPFGRVVSFDDPAMASPLRDFMRERLEAWAEATHGAAHAGLADVEFRNGSASDDDGRIVFEASGDDPQIVCSLGEPSTLGHHWLAAVVTTPVKTAAEVFAFGTDAHGNEIMEERELALPAGVSFVLVTINETPVRLTSGRFDPGSAAGTYEVWDVAFAGSRGAGATEG